MRKVIIAPAFHDTVRRANLVVVLPFENGARGNVGRKHERLHERIHAGGGPFARLHVCITHF